MFLGKSENTAGPEISKIRTPEKKPLESKQVGFSCLGFCFGLFGFFIFFCIWVFSFVYHLILLMNLIIMFIILFVCYLVLFLNVFNHYVY